MAIDSFSAIHSGSRTAATEESEPQERPAKRVKLEHCSQEVVAKLSNPWLDSLPTDFFLWQISPDLLSSLDFGTMNNNHVSEEAAFHQQHV